jgi:catechol 2,3-dioxygenase-like lactoylglutathione lyase family enzyme
MALTRIHHHTFIVSDMDCSLKFWRDALGFKLIADVLRENVPAYDEVMAMKDVKVRVAMLKDPSDQTMVALLHYHNPAPVIRPMGNQFVGSCVLAVQTDDIDADFARLKAMGVRFNSKVVDVVREGKLAARIVYAFDPDNIVVELYQPMT